MTKFIVFSLYFSLISALAFNAPLATPIWKGFQLEARGWSPRPTAAPSLDDLRKRQNIQNLLLASDGVCGYISGISASPFGLCCSTCTCGFATTPGYYGGLYCCNTAACESRAPTTCIDNNRFSVSSACNSKCVSDQLTLKCTASPYVYCNLAEFEGVNVQALFCDSVTISHTQSMYTTYAGEVGRVFSTFTGFPGSTSKSVSFTAPTPLSSTTVSSSSSSSSSSPSPSPYPTTSSSQNQVIPASQTSSTSPASPTNSSSPAPIGAIVGGSVGGVAVIAIIGVLVFFLLRRRRTASQAGPPGDPYSTAAAFGPEKHTAPSASPEWQGVVAQQPTWSREGRQHPTQEQQGAHQYSDPRYPQQDGRYSQQYQQQHDPSQQVEAQYGHHVPPIPRPAELQSATHDSSANYGGGRQGRKGTTVGRHEVQG